MDTEGTFLGMMGSGGGDDRQEAEERRGINGGGCEGREGIIGLASSQKKLARTDTFDPFRVSSPFSPVHDGPTSYNGGSNKGQGLRPNDSDDVSFPVALEMTSAIRSPFTPAQWQELEQQALIFKHMVASVPVPLELLLPIRRSLAASSIVHNTPSHGNPMSLGGFNVLRCSSSTDPEPGRCRRTDGKKWRCSRDVAPDQRYCERHMHRGRPRSRKPVEVRQQRPNSSINDTPPSTALARSLSSLAPPLSSFTQETPPKPTETSEFRVPSQTTMTSSNLTDNSPRYVNWMRGETEDDDMVSTGADSLSTSTHRGELLQSKFGGTHELPLRLSTNNAPCYRVHHENLAFLPDSADLQRNHIQGDGNSVLASDHSNVLESSVSQPRRFIDAWSIENRWQQHCTVTAKSSASKLSPSHLSLSMSGGAGSAGDEFDQIQMGLGVNDTENMGALTAPSPSWMLPVSWQASSPVGGPLAEVLQSTSGALAADPNPLKSSNSKTGSSNALNLLTDGWGCESSLRTASSPTGVLQKNLAFLSDSGGVIGSPKLGAKPEMVLQWLNQQEPPKLPS